MVKYQQIALEMERYIQNNRLSAGDKLPVLDSILSRRNSESAKVRSLNQYIYWKEKAFSFK